ncbi:hypothetical protein HTZ84_19230 [Haloterrigena sp. SYSU A558-1]|uniref:Uncharacterized protein n=1 Tax=Haloterrigena gelatinilytica TaxID=2741724 RepID=A0A8J8GK29_9EURY|nr:hypothetical protein [Haloterrigena gelatinilytica]NUB89767.1 hypothetical protein [Haloterrigena gelatinilytica]NUC74401.1 hypothetical protein [Haloterrigena gelatinilytica]
MERNTARDRYVPRSTWTAASCETLSALTTVLALAFAASLLTASIGAPEDVVTIAVATVGIVAVGLALTRLFTALEANGLPVLE